MQETSEDQGIYRSEFQRRGTGFEEVWPPPSPRTLGIGVGVCYETKSGATAVNVLFFFSHKRWVFTGSVLGLRLCG